MNRAKYILSHNLPVSIIKHQNTAGGKKHRQCLKKELFELKDTVLYWVKGYFFFVPEKPLYLPHDYRVISGAGLPPLDLIITTLYLSPF